MKKLLLTLTAMSVISLHQAMADPSPATVKIYNFTVTAASSPSNPSSLQNAMSYIDKGGVIGYIPTDTATNPAALNRPHMLRVSDIIWSAPGYFMWDATNNPSGPFANENGKRLAWGLDWSQTTQFLASDIYFKASSSESAHALYYAGNVATNTDGSNTPLAFSSTLRGELWDANGVPIAEYYSGENVASHPVNRVLCLIREGYYAAAPTNTTLDLSYFKNHMTLGASVQFYMIGGQTNSASINSLPYLDPDGSTGGYGMFQLEGQRQLGMTYSIQGTGPWAIVDPLHPDDGIPWVNLTNGLVDGSVYTGTYYPNGFFQALEGNVVVSEAAMKSPSNGQATVPAPVPLFKISNGPE